MAGKFLVRISVIFLGIYFLLGYAIAFLFGENIHSDFYVIILEVIVVVYSYSEGKYHCRHLKHTAAAVCASDTITRVDYYFDIFTVNAIFVINATILAFGIGLSVFLSIRHFILVKN